MDKYRVLILPHAARDLESIYEYIAGSLSARDAAEKIMLEFEDAITSLEEMPNRGAMRKIGVYKDKGYRQLFVGNYAVIYRVDNERHMVLIVTARYIKSSF